MNFLPSLTCRTALCVLAFGLASGALHAQSIWKWRDKDGRVQISDRPPPNDVPDRDIVQRPNLLRGASVAPAAPAGSDAASAPGVSRVDPALEARKNKAQAEQLAAEQAKRDADKAKRDLARAETCDRARSRMQGLESGVRVGRVNAQGQREILGDEDRAAEMARMRDVIAANCN